MDHGEGPVRELGRFWDVLIQEGTPSTSDPELDAELAELVVWLHAARPGPAPNAARERVWRRLELFAKGSPALTPPRAPTHSARTPPGTLALPEALRHEDLIVRPLGRRALTQLATAALLLLTLALGFTAIWQRPPATEDKPAQLPALIRAVASVPADVVDERLTEATFTAEELPAVEPEVIFYQLTLPPSTSLPSLAGSLCGCWGGLVTAGVGVEVVRSGDYTLRLNTPIRVERIHDARAGEEVPAQTEVVLGAGDAATYPDYAAPGEIRNASDEPVVIVGAAIVDMDESQAAVSSLPMGVRFERLSRTISSEWRSLPAGPMTVSLWRLTLPDGTRVGPYEAIGLEALRVETGAIRRSLLQPDETAPRGQPLVHIAGTSAPFMAPAPGLRRIITNASDQPTIVLALSIEPAGIWSGTLAP